MFTFKPLDLSEKENTEPIDREKKREGLFLAASKFVGVLLIAPIKKEFLPTDFRGRSSEIKMYKEILRYAVIIARIKRLLHSDTQAARIAFLF